MNETRLQFHSYCPKRSLKRPQNEPHQWVLFGEEAAVAQLGKGYFQDKTRCFNHLFQINLLSKRGSKEQKKAKKKKNFQFGHFDAQILKKGAHLRMACQRFLTTNLTNLHEYYKACDYFPLRSM